jgi:hypothetical protein
VGEHQFSKLLCQHEQHSGLMQKKEATLKKYTYQRSQKEPLLMI